MNPHVEHLQVDGVAAAFNPVGGHILDFSIDAPTGKPLRPLHVAPWYSERESLPTSVPLVERQLAGDFFCAPFGALQGEPIHGWTANGHWHSQGTMQESDGARISRFMLEEPISGAHVSKELMLCPGHPILYQCHRFTGGSGHLPVAHHAMIRVPGGARLSFSPKQFGVTPDHALESDPERGRSLLLYPQRFSSLNTVQTLDGQTVDASTYPFASGHEDIVVLAESADRHIAWSAALARADGFLFFAIKDANTLPETVLWMSHGGRQYAPWSGRHTHVLGIEEAATSCHADGTFSSQAGHSAAGLARGLTLKENATQTIHYCFGAIPAPSGWSEVTDIRVATDTLEIQDVDGETMSVRFKGSHFGL